MHHTRFTVILVFAGQLLQDDVSINEAKKELNIPDHAPISVSELSAWELHRDVNRVRSDHHCWSTTVRGEDVIKGDYVDYRVDSVFSTGFRFGGL